MGKGNSSKVDETNEFLTLGHSNWTICSLLNWFCPKNFPHFYPASHNKPFLYTAEGRKEGAGAENRKSELFKSEWDTGVPDPRAFKLDHLQPVKQILLQKISPFYPASHNKPFLITPERGRKAENWKRELPKSEWDTGVSDPGAFKLNHLQPVKLILFHEISTFLPSLP